MREIIGKELQQIVLADLHDEKFSCTAVESCGMCMHPFESHRSAQQFRAVEADTAQNLHHICDKANMKHRLGQLNVPKVARTVLDICPICLTFEITV